MKDYKYLYINGFTWLDEEMMDSFGYEPKVGHVYKASDNAMFYKLTFKENQEHSGVNIQKSDLKNDDETGNWTCDIEVITVKNLFDFDISDKDMSMMANDVSHEIDYNPDGMDKMVKNDLKEALTELREMDNEMYEALSRVTSIMARAITDGSRVVLTDTMQWHPKTAKTTSVALTISALELYLSSDDDTNYVLDAIYPLIIEMMRQHKIHRHD